MEKTDEISLSRKWLNILKSRYLEKFSEYGKLNFKVGLMETEYKKISAEMNCLRDLLHSRSLTWTETVSQDLKNLREKQHKLALQLDFFRDKRKF